MKSVSTPSIAALVLSLSLQLQPRAAGAQQWNDTRSRGLVERATALRALQLADTALRDYRAEARGYVTFLAQFGEGFTEPPKIVRADELALELYWRAPNLSKQLIIGRRDTLLLPTDINYHRDHLGIVQNNFPSIIRLGDGDEVKDVPHPLSSAGLAAYDFSIADSVEIRFGPRTLQVYEVRVRPKDDRAPRAIGALHIDRQTAELVRMTLSFTRAALIDKDLEDVTVVLENGLIEGRFWLPRRQEIEIRRSGTWLDYPARGIIRGRWEICCYRVNTGIDARLFAGPEIVLAPRPPPPPRPRPGDTISAPIFTGAILDSLPGDVRAVTDEDVKEIQEEARRLVRGQALARSRTSAFSGRRVSDFVRVNRVEGLALGMGVTQRLGSGFSLVANARYGLEDEKWKGRFGATYRHARGAGVSFVVYDEHRDAGDEMERSLLVNSIAAQEMGSDYTDPFGVRGAALSFSARAPAGWLTTLALIREDQRPLQLNAEPTHGEFAPVISAAKTDERRIELALEQPTRLFIGGFESRYRLVASMFSFRLAGGPDVRRVGRRVAAHANFERPFGTNRLVARFFAGAVGDEKVGYPAYDLYIGAPSSVQPQHLVYLGGTVTGPGYRYHQFAGTSGASARLEWRSRVPFVGISLGRFGRSPASMTLAPYVSTVWMNGFRALTPLQGFYPSVGLGALTVFDLLRIDVARGLRGGRWSFSMDLTRDLWPVL